MKSIESYIQQINDLIEQDKLEEAKDITEEGLKIEAQNGEMKALEHQIQQQLKLKCCLPKDDIECQKAEQLGQWMKDGGTEFEKLKVVHYTRFWRGLHATHDMKANEVVLFIPYK